MNVLLISPGFPVEMPQFTRGLAEVGAREPRPNPDYDLGLDLGHAMATRKTRMKAQ